MQCGIPEHPQKRRSELRGHAFKQRHAKRSAPLHQVARPATLPLASGLDLGPQRDAVARLAKSAPILAEHTEMEWAKSHRNRPQLLAAVAEAKKRDATSLIAKPDRLARNVHFIRAIPLTLHIFAATAEHECRMISQRTEAGVDAAKREIDANGFRVSRRSGRPYSKLGNPNWLPAPEAANRAKRKPEQVAAAVAVRGAQFSANGGQAQ